MRVYLDCLDTSHREVRRGDANNIGVDFSLGQPDAPLAAVTFRWAGKLAVRCLEASVLSRDGDEHFQRCERLGGRSWFVSRLIKRSLHLAGRCGSCQSHAVYIRQSSHFSSCLHSRFKISMRVPQTRIFIFNCGLWQTFTALLVRV